MNQISIERSEAEIAEIEKHKYFLSERAGYDVGWQAAEEDWDSNYAEEFRQSTNPEPTPAAEQKTGTFFRRLLAKARAR
jgi:hypothetical protein